MQYIKYNAKKLNAVMHDFLAELFRRKQLHHHAGCKSFKLFEQTTHKNECMADVHFA